MSFILTMMWLVGMTWLGYWVGGNFFDGHNIAFAIGFFIIAVVVRLLFMAGSGSGGSSSDNGFLEFMGLDTDGGGRGSSCGGGSSCSSCGGGD